MTDGKTPSDRLIVDLMEALQRVLAMMEHSELDRQITNLTEDFQRLNTTLERVATVMETSAKTMSENMTHHRHLSQKFEEAQKRDIATQARLTQVEAMITEIHGALCAPMDD